MDRKVQRVVFKTPVKLNLTRVAAYGRVSSGKDAMLHSLSAQVSYYSELIQTHDDWIYCGVYTDEALTGTKDNRPEFQRLMEDCRAGRIDLILTKSISRFARNTVTLLEAVRELKALGVGVVFEEQNINTLTAEGELMLTILASYAQEESLSASENKKWQIQNDYEQGILPMCYHHIYGYTRLPNGDFVINKDEAEIVRDIFRMYLDGLGSLRIAAVLNEKGIPSNTNERWTEKKVLYIISNEMYIGNLMMQKYFVVDHLTKKKQANRGEKPKYYVCDNHEPIISRDMFDAVQEERRLRGEKYNNHLTKNNYIFTKKIVCGNCGRNYRRKVTATRVVWICRTFDKYGKKHCPAKAIPEETLYAISAEVLGLNEFDKYIFSEEIEKIIVPKANVLKFVFKDGRIIETQWQDRSRRESWTPQMREQARQKTLQRRQNNG